jgi:hypothetical protein
MITTAVPKAFLSHSTKDMEIASKLARDLTAKRVDVWYADWAIKPGDSLRRKIDEGIEGASYFLVLLTPASLKSEWVQTELDAGMVKRIEGSCRLIPIILDLSHDQVPVTMRTLKWVSLNPYDEGLRQLIAVCHNVETKPSLGPAPAWTKSELSSELGLSIHAQRLAILLAEQSRNADILDPQLDAAEVRTQLDVTGAELEMAVDELQELGWATGRGNIRTGEIGFGIISPEPELFCHIDPHVKGWNPETDAHALAVTLVNSGEDMMRLEEADNFLGWGPRRINPAAYFLNSRGLAKGHVRQAGDNPYTFYYLQVTPKAKRFASQ